MDDPLTSEQLFWLEVLMTSRPGDSLGDMPVRELLIVETASVYFSAWHMQARSQDAQ